MEKFVTVVVKGQKVEKYSINKKGEVKNSKGHIIKERRGGVRLYFDGAHRYFTIKNLLQWTFFESIKDETSTDKILKKAKKESGKAVPKWELKDTATKLYKIKDDDGGKEYYPTKDQSAIITAKLLKESGVENNDFFLKLLNPELENIDPHSTNLTVVEQSMIYEECQRNPWYFFRECLRIPAVGGRFIKFKLNTVAALMIHYTISGVDTYIISPRNTYRSVSLISAAIYLTLFQNKKIRYSGALGNETGTSKFHEVSKGLPQFMKTILDMKISRVLTEGSDFIINPQEKEEVSLLDDFEYMKDPSSELNNLDKKNVTIGTTVGNPSENGFDPTPLIEGCIKWDPKFLDLSINSVKSMVLNSDSKMLYIELSAHQIVEDADNWLKVMERLLMHQKDIIARELYNVRTKPKVGKPKAGIELDYIITNGYVDLDTIVEREKKGWKFVATVPAKLIHPHALPTDKATIFSRYVSSVIGAPNTTWKEKK